MAGNLVTWIEPTVSVPFRGKSLQRLMRPAWKSCVWGLVLGGSGVLGAQSQPNAQPAQRAARPSPAKTRLAPQLLNADEGLAILGAALESRHKSETRSDCSHLVHTIYEKAGFPYEYVPSSDLYAGIDDFRRITRPQPGDLVVWPGHAGIVVNPPQHTFYSALRSGFGVQPYNSVYWKGRGRPHFFRYVKTVPLPVLPAANRTASLKQAGLRNGGAIGTAPAIALVNAPEPENDGPTEPATKPEPPAIPAVVVVKAVRPKPEQLRSALQQQFRETGDTLQTQDVFQLRPALVAFDQLEVQKVYVKGDKGWADVRIRDTVAMSGTPVGNKKYGRVQRWDLQRKEGSWELGLPQDTVYVPREAAARILAHQLAALTDSSSTNERERDQKAQLARWLSLLLDDPAAH
jgi:NlpC/P60 family